MRAFAEDYKGVVGFEVVPVGEVEDLRHYIEKDTDIYDSMRALASRLNELGWTPSNAGNISVRESPHHTGFFITASGSYFSDLKPEDVVGVQSIEIDVGDITLDIGSNRGVDGEMNPSRIVHAMEKQGLFQPLLEELGIENPRPKPGETECELAERGRYLIKELKLEELCQTQSHMTNPTTPEALLTRRFIDVLAERCGLSEYDKRALRTAHHCENIPIYNLYEDAIHDKDSALSAVGLGLKDLITYLGERSLINCKVYATGSRKPSSETLLHAAIYAKRWEYNDVNAVVHCHAPSMVDRPPKGISVTDTDQKIIGYGSLELAAETLEALGTERCVVLKGHGPVAVSEEWDGWEPASYLFERVFRTLEHVDKKVRIPKNLRRVLDFIGIRY